MHGVVSCIQTLSENSFFIPVSSYTEYLNFVKYRVLYLPNLKNKSSFFITFVCHHYSIQMIFSKPKAGCKETHFWNLSMLCIVVLLCYLYFSLMSCHFFNIILIKPQCMCKTKILDKGQRGLPFVGSVPKKLQCSLQILITLQLLVVVYLLIMRRFLICASL